LLQGEGDKKFTLDAAEFALARDLNRTLIYHKFQQKLVAGYLTVLTRHHLPEYKVAEGVGLEFEIDLSDQSDKVLMVKEVPLSED
jgi:hypothetical protein